MADISIKADYLLKTVFNDDLSSANYLKIRSWHISK